MPLRHAAFDQGIAPTIAFVNKASVPLGDDFGAMCAAMQKFLDVCFAPIWGTPAKIVAADSATPGQWEIVFLDDPDTAGALGYHDLTKGGLPLSKVFVKTTLSAGEKVSVTACHELAEMMVDPAINLWSTGPKGALWAYEMSDAVETEEFDIDGIAMSDFVTPAYFEKFRDPGSARFDYLGKIRKTFQILPGGYSIVHTGGREGQIFGRLPYERRPDGTLVVFGSEEKAEKFLAEDRRMHRSEYREPPVVGGGDIPLTGSDYLVPPIDEEGDDG